MRIIYLSLFDYPTRYAHPQHARSMVRAFASTGAHVTFVVNTCTDPKELEGIKYVVPFGRWGRRIKKMHVRSPLLFLWLLFKMLTDRTYRGDVWYYVNDVRLASLLSILRHIWRFRFAFEAHGLFTKRIRNRMRKNADLIIAVTDELRDAYTGDAPVYIERNAVDIQIFKPSHKTSRRGASLPEGFIMLYTGRPKPMGIEKGLAFMIEALLALPSDISLVCVGASPAEKSEYDAYATTCGVGERLMIVTYQTQQILARYMQMADVLVYVPPVKSEFFERETSPMKLFEYAAVGKPIILSRMPTFEHILDDTQVYYIEPGNTEQFVHAVQNIKDGKHDHYMDEKNKKWVRHYTWEARARRICAYCMRI